MVSVVTGRKHFNVSKNLESNDGMYYSKVYARNCFSPDRPILPRPTDETINQINNLKQILNEKDKRLKELKDTLNRPTVANRANPVYPEIINSSAYASQQCKNIYSDHFKALEYQLIDNHKRKIEEFVEKQKETKERLQRMLALREVEQKERMDHLRKNEEYRKHLDVQQSLKKTIGIEERQSRSLSPRDSNKYKPALSNNFRFALKQSYPIKY